MNSNNIKTQVFSIICRTCLQSGDHLTPLHNTAAAEMLNECDFCKVLEPDGLPNQICTVCLKMLEQCYSFKQLCRKSDNILRQALANEESHLLATKSREEENSLDSSDLQDELTKTDSNLVTEITRTEDSGDLDLISFLGKPLPPPLPHQCQHCTQSFSEENDLQIHQSIHNSDLVCSACDKKFTRRQTLKRHLKTHLIQKPHVCKICGKSFSESYALVKHMRHHSGIPREKKHFCEDCGQGFSEPYYLKVHVRKHTGERPLVCPECRKTFADPRSLKTHVLIHSGVRPYKCQICMKGFIQNANLTKHMRVHTGEKPYVCKFCEKKFSQSSSLEKHVQIHTGEKRGKRRRFSNGVQTHEQDRGRNQKVEIERKFKGVNICGKDHNPRRPQPEIKVFLMEEREISVS